MIQVLHFLLVVMCFAAGSCERPGTKERDAAAKSARASDPNDEGDAAVAIADPPPRPMLGASLDSRALMERLQKAEVKRMKLVGTNSIVFRASTDQEIDVSYRPRANPRPWGYKAEIAAYQISRLLEMDNVPPGVVRSMSRGVLRGHLDPRFEDDWPSIVQALHWTDGDSVRGAMLYWVPAMESLDLERSEWKRRWSVWLSQDGSVPPAESQLAADISTMIAFDYLIGNWDRFSGGNTHVEPRSRRLFIRDHDLSFATPLPERLHRRILDMLLLVERFSRRFVENLASFDRAHLEHVLASEPTHAQDPLLSESQIQDLMERHATLLSYVASLIDAHGEDKVLAFP